MNFTSLITLLAIIFIYSWQASRNSAAGGVSTWEHFKPSLKRYSGFRELLLFVFFLLFYKMSRTYAIGDDQTAFDNAQRVIEWENQLGIFYELPIQQFFLDKTILFEVINWIYIKLHIPTTIIFFVWLFYKRREHYLYIRNGFLVANIITLFFFLWFPCAPPRMINGSEINEYSHLGLQVIENLKAMGIYLNGGFMDTLYEISGINLYAGINKDLFNQFAAMPSMHFGNSLLIGLGIFWYSKKQWLKGIIMLYPVFVLTVIVMTGNHFFLDAVLGGIIVVTPYIFMNLIEKIAPSWKERFRGSESFVKNLPEIKPK